ncbi:MAG TPA: alpha-glucan family phosphorylase [Candidatus Omnitrophota bacterium]|nr:alpha-glucan family phosphorylase [Candidatus Omnitrophota bacterium]HQQ05538.1 alpha-glucan family phosphorylase [Candidatus Omnitrophota bacterium]
MPGRQLLTEFLSLVQVDGFEDVFINDIVHDKFFGMPLEPIIAAEKRLRDPASRSMAYLSMEYGLATSFYNKFTATKPLHYNNRIQETEVFSNFRLADYFFTLKADSIIDLPIYSGGLGVLAGDTVKTMADYKLPAVAVGMLWNTGYFRQKFWFKYGQMPEAMHWDLYSYPGLIPLKNKIKISLKNEEIYLRLWKYYVYSYQHDAVVPLILLDSNAHENIEKNRRLTDQLYRSDNNWIKIMQRVILGMGGVAALKELGYPIDLFHLNEGHAVFAFVEKARGLPADGIRDLKKHFVYTCHTPVDAGHDRFPSDELRRILKRDDFEVADTFGRDKGGVINLTLLSMNIASRINAVSHNHQKVMHIQFPKYRDQIQYVTNGVHPHTWMSDRFKAVCERFTKHFGDVKANPMALARAGELRADQGFRQAVWEAHQANKQDLCDLLGKWKFDKNAFTICWARRVAAYKRPSLILQDVKALIDIGKKYGPLQIIFAGKAHPSDNLGFTFINEMLDRVDELTDVYDHLRFVMLENYEISTAKTLVSGVDAWLNNPLPPFEASGTSGMKAILNAVVQISTIDGWIAEATDMDIGKFFGYVNEEGSIGNEHDLHMHSDSVMLYKALEEMVGMYYGANKKGVMDVSSTWIDLMINCLAASAQFNTYRMLDQYKSLVWNIS